MIDVEIVMSQPFVYLVAYNTLRKRLLDNIVDVMSFPEQTREIVLRTINSTLGSIFVRLDPQKEQLQVPICEKRGALDIEEDLTNLQSFYLDGAKKLVNYGVIPQHVTLLESSLVSNNAALRVAGKCATILMAAFIEMDNPNG